MRPKVVVCYGGSGEITAIVLLLVLGLLNGPAWTQSNSSQSSSGGFVSAWFQRSSRAESEQPHWAAPMFTVTPRLVQQFRYDIGWQSISGFTNANYGIGKGLELELLQRPIVAREHKAILARPVDKLTELDIK